MATRQASPKMQQIQRTMDNFGRVELVIFTSYKNPDKPIRTIEYRVFGNGSDQFIKASRFQVRKFFTESQRDNDDLYHDIKKDIKGDESVCFGEQLRRVQSRKDRAVSDIRYATMLACIQDDSGTVYL